MVLLFFFLFFFDTQHDIQGADLYFYYLNLLYISVVPNSTDKVKGIRKQAMEHTDKSAVSFNMRVF